MVGQKAALYNDDGTGGVLKEIIVPIFLDGSMIFWVQKTDTVGLDTVGKLFALLGRGIKDLRAMDRFRGIAVLMDADYRQWCC